VATTMVALPRSPQSIRAASPPDRTSRWLALASTLMSIVAYVRFSASGQTLMYWDSVSHLEIARRVVDSPTPGLGQLGTTWLPLPHLLVLPFVGFDSLYYSGLAGSIISMASYVVASVLLYKITYSLTNSKLAGLVTAVVFMTNPNILYMQSTPMSELLLFATLAGMVYSVQRWIQTDNYRYLQRGALAGLMCALTRYEAWVLVLVMAAVVLFVAWRKHGRRYADGSFWAFSLPAVFVGVGAWFLWCGLILGNPLDFYNGAYSKPSIWVNNNELAIGNLWASIQTYYYAVVDNLSWPLLVLALLGVVAVLIKCRPLVQILPVASLLVLFPFFVYALYSGQRPLHVEQLGEGLYNVRFGLLMIIPAAVFCGYLVHLVAKRFQLIPVAIVGTFVGVAAIISLVIPSSIVTFREPYSVLNDEFRVMSIQAGVYLGQHYAPEDGRILMQSFGNEWVLPAGHVDSGVNIYEGSNKGGLWMSSLQDPAGNKIGWIVMRQAGLANQPDLVHDRLYGTSALADYEQVYNNRNYVIYKRTRR